MSLPVGPGWDRGSAMRKAGCLGLLLLFGALMGELWLYLAISQSRLLDADGDYLIPLIAIIVAMVVGAKVLQSAVKTLPTVVMTGGAGRILVRAFAGGLLLFPGLGTDALGLLLLLPGVGQLFGRLGDKVLASIVKRSMGRMLGGAGGGFPFGGAGGFPGGFPFPGGGAFPGMKPDDRARFPKPPPKTYDTTPEKD